jgi:beta-glucosidase
MQQINWHVDVRDDHAALIRNIGARGTVLLKNRNHALPLKKPRFLAVIGDDAGPNPLGPNGCGDRGCDNGTLGMAWGSGTANFPYLVTPDTALQNQAIADGSRYESVLNNYATSQIRALVSQQDVTAIVFVNADGGEGYIAVDGNEGDRKNLTLWRSGDDLIKNVSAICNNTIVVIHSIGPTILTDWYSKYVITSRLTCVTLIVAAPMSLPFSGLEFLVKRAATASQMYSTEKSTRQHETPSHGVQPGRVMAQICFMLPTMA